VNVRSIMPEQNREWTAGARQRAMANAKIFHLIQGFSRISPLLSVMDSGRYLLTERHKYVYMLHGQNQTSRPKDSSAPAKGQPQSSSRKGCRSPVCRLELLRCPRPSSGQIRDGAQGPGRLSARQPQRDGLRLLSSFVLSSAGPPRERRSGGLGTAKARAAAQAQARCRGDDVSSETEVRRPITKAVGSGRSHPGALRPQGPCPQHRTGARAPEKKSP